MRRNLCGVALNLMQGWDLFAFSPWVCLLFLVHNNRFSNCFSSEHENGEGVFLVLIPVGRELVVGEITTISAY